MRLLFITGFPYLPQRFGGAERSIDCLARALKSQGHHVGVYAGLYNGGWTGYVTRLRRKILSQRPPKTLYNGYVVYRTWHQAQLLPQALTDLRPDAAVLQSGKPLQFAQTILDQGTPLILHLRDAEFSKLGGDPRDYPFCLVIANSHYIASAFYNQIGRAHV